MNNIKSGFTIKDLENISGIKAHTIRIWEKRYNLLKPSRTDTNIRFYTNENLQKLLNVVVLNNNGFKISKIAKMTDEEVLLKVRELTLKEAVNEEAINTFKLAMFTFDKILFNKTYNRLLKEKTFRAIFKDVFLPLLKNIGVLWQTKSLLPVHEHFISNLIMQKVQLNTEKLDYTVVDGEYTYVLFLPENEIHELALLYLNYELILRGEKTIYLGRSIPLSNLEYFFNEAPFKICFLTNLTIKPYEDTIESYLKEIDTILDKTSHKFVALGRRVEDFKNHQFKSDIEIHSSILDFLKNLE